MPSRRKKEAKDPFPLLTRAGDALARWNLSPLTVLLAIFLLGIVVRAVPLHYDGYFDPDAHFHARLSEDIARTGSLVEWDSLSLQGRVYSYTWGWPSSLLSRASASFSR